MPELNSTFDTPTVVVKDMDCLSNAIESIGLRPPYSTIAIIGGVNIDDRCISGLKALFNVIALLAQSHQLAIVDGGTNYGIMRLMGEARANIDGTFPLIGVLPAAKVTGNQTNVELESHHTHILLCPGEEWGDESLWLARLASVLSEKKPSITILANGGAVAWLDVACSLAEGRTVVTVAGTGRTADILAEGVRGGLENQRLALAFSALGLLHVLDVNSDHDFVGQRLKALLKLEV